MAAIRTRLPGTRQAVNLAPGKAIGDGEAVASADEIIAGLRIRFPAVVDDWGQLVRPVTALHEIAWQ